MVTVATGVRDIRDTRSDQGVFAITNWNSDVVLDCDSTTTGELADIIGTLIKILIEQGILNGTVASA